MLAPFPGTRFRESIAGGLPEEQYSQQIPWILSNAIESNRSRPSPSNNGATQLSKQRPFILTSPSAELVRDEERSCVQSGTSFIPAQKSACKWFGRVRERVRRTPYGDCLRLAWDYWHKNNRIIKCAGQC